MIKAISYWSMKDGLSGTCPLEDALAAAETAGFAGLELCVGTDGLLTPATSQATCETWRSKIEAAKVVVETVASGMTWAVNCVSDDAKTRAKAIDLHKGALQRVAWLGAKAMLFVPGSIGGPISAEQVRYDVAVDRARGAVEQLLAVAEDVGVDLCVENVWNGLFYSPVEFAGFIDQFGSDRLGVYFDVGNVLGYHQYPPHWIELLGERIRRVHIKDFKSAIGNLSGFCDLTAGDMPWPETMAALKKIGYDGTVTAEMIPWDPSVLARTSAAMDVILAM